LEQVGSASESTGAVELIDGEGRCPNEDGGGGKKYQSEVLDVWFGDEEEWPRTQRSLSGAQNVKPGVPFDPEDFDLAERREAIASALSSRACAQEGSKMFVHELQGGGSMSTSAGTAAFLPGRPVTRTVESHRDSRDADGEAVCASCGNPNDLSRCSGCRMVFYCGRECQRAHWRAGGHKEKGAAEKDLRKRLKKRAPQTQAEAEAAAGYGMDTSR